MSDHRPDRYDLIEIEGPEEAPLPSWLTADWMPCMDCRANVFFVWLGHQWHVTVAHDEGCPAMRAMESHIESSVEPPEDGAS